MPAQQHIAPEISATTQQLQLDPIGHDLQRPHQPDLLFPQQNVGIDYIPPPLPVPPNWGPEHDVQLVAAYRAPRRAFSVWGG